MFYIFKILKMIVIITHTHTYVLLSIRNQVLYIQTNIRKPSLQTLQSKKLCTQLPLLIFTALSNIFLKFPDSTAEIKINYRQQHPFVPSNQSSALKMHTSSFLILLGGLFLVQLFPKTQIYVSSRCLVAQLELKALSR